MTPPKRYHVILDPAKRRCGVALFHGPILAWAATLNGAPAQVAAGIAAVLREFSAWDCNLVAEWPRDYAAGRSKHVDLESLRTMVHAIEKRLTMKARRVYPSQWKGNVPKEITETRIALILTSEEMATFQDTRDDTFDAVGLGLFTRERARRGMVRNG